MICESFVKQHLLQTSYVLYICPQQPPNMQHTAEEGEKLEKASHPHFFHGDGVPTTGVGKSWGKSLNVFDWGSLLARGPTKQIVFWIWSVFAAISSKRTMEVFWKIMKWSFNALFSGKHPDKDFHGEPYPAGSAEAKLAGKPLVGSDPGDHYFCVIWRFKGDGDFNQQEQETRQTT